MAESALGMSGDVHLNTNPSGVPGGQGLQFLDSKLVIRYGADGIVGAEIVGRIRYGFNDSRIAVTSVPVSAEHVAQLRVAIDEIHGHYAADITKAAFLAGSQCLSTAQTMGEPI